jgi:OHCU decarboxylase
VRRPAEAGGRGRDRRAGASEGARQAAAIGEGARQDALTGEGAAAAGLDRLDGFNALPAYEAEASLLACCGCAAWARALAARRPFADAASLLGAAEHFWWILGPAGWREAFAAHPRIGERIGETAGGRSAGCPGGGRSIAGLWSEAEQAGARAAPAAVLDELAAANRLYESRFGYIFLVCATGKSGAEMLGALRARLGNDPATELRIAAGEQAKITRLRLARLLE